MTTVQVSDTHQRLVVELDDIQDSPESEQTERGGCGLEIQTKAIRRFVITEKALEEALSMITNLRMDFFEALVWEVLEFVIKLLRQELFKQGFLN